MEKEMRVQISGLSILCASQKPGLCLLAWLFHCQHVRSFRTEFCALSSVHTLRGVQLDPQLLYINLVPLTFMIYAT